MLDVGREAQARCRQLTESVDNLASAKELLEPQGHDGGAGQRRRLPQGRRRRRSGRPTRQQFGELWDQITLQGLERIAASGARLRIAASTSSRSPKIVIGGAAC